MKKILIIIAFILIACNSFAQFGTATITMNVDGGERKFIFPNVMGTLVTATQNSEYTDIDFSNLFEKQHEYVFVHIRIQPNGTGTFIIPPENSQPKNIFSIEVTYQKQTTDGDIQKEIKLINNSAHDGASGSAIITQYGPDAVGSFEATIGEIKDGGSNGSLFKVSGNFKIKLMKQ